MKIMKYCPECGNETRTGWWLRWCSSTNRCKWFRLMSKEEREEEMAKVRTEIQS